MNYEFLSCPGVILGMGSANERWRYNVTSSLIGLAHAQNGPWSCWCQLWVWICCIHSTWPTFKLDWTSCILSIHSLFHVLVSQNGCWKIWPTFAGLGIFWANLICTIVAGSLFHHVSAGAIMCWQYELGNVTISRSNITFRNYPGMNAWGPCWW